VARRLAEKAENRIADDEDDDIEILALHQLTPELAEAIGKSETTIFVDADCEQEPGRISCKVISPHPATPGATTHHLDPPNLLAFTQAIYGTIPKTAVLLTVSGESFGLEEGLSPTALAAIPVLERILHAMINAVRGDVVS